MRCIKSLCLIMVCYLMVPVVLAGSYTDKGAFPAEPVMNGDQRWRIGYFEGGEYTDYQKILIETVKGLMQKG